MTNHLKNGIRGAIAITVFSILANFSGYFSRLLLANNLSVESFGLFYSVMSLVLFLFLFVNLGYGSASTKFIASSAYKDGKRVRAIVHFTSLRRLSLGVMISFILFFSANFLAQSFFRSAQAALMLKIMAVVIIFFVLTKIFANILQGEQRFFLVGASIFLEKFLFLISIMVLLYLGYAGSGVLATYAFLFGIFLLFLLLLPFVLSRFSLTAKADEGLKSSINRFARASFLLSLGTLVIGYIDTLMLTYFGDLAQVGIYNAVLPTVVVLSFLGKSIQTVFLPLASQLSDQKQEGLLHAGLVKTYRYVVLITLPVALAMFFFPERILLLLFGVEFVSGAVAMRILALGVVFLNLTTIDQGVLSGLGRPGVVTKVLVIVAIMNFLLNLILIPYFGMNGAAFATLVSYGLTMVWLSLELKSGKGRVFLKALLPSFAFVLTLVMLPKTSNVAFISSLMLSSLIFLVIGFLSRLVSLRELRDTFNTIKEE